MLHVSAKMAFKHRIKVFLQLRKYYSQNKMYISYRNFSINVPIYLHVTLSRGKRLAQGQIFLRESTFNMTASDIPSTKSINNNMQREGQHLTAS